MEDRTLTLSKHEVVIDLDMLEEIMQYSNKALAWDKLFSMFECQPEQPKLNLFERERMIHILREVEDE